MSSLDNILFCVLSRFTNTYYNNLCDDLNQKKINTFILKDNEHYTKISELQNIGFQNLNNIGTRFGSVIAWDKIFYHIYINNLFDIYKYFYIIEDDVYAQNIDCFYDLILDWQNYNSDLITKKIKSKNDSPYWPFWKRNPSLLFDNPHKSLNPLCRLSSNLVKLLINYALNNKTFIFQEILFASLCVKENLSIIEYSSLENSNKYISKIVWNKKQITEIDKQSTKIYHPEKHICIT